MRKLAITLALASTAIATPALARDDAWYIGVEGGASIVEDATLGIINANGTVAGVGNVNHDTGYDFDGIIGYDFGGFRLEAEVGYKEAGVKDYSSTTTTGFRGTSGGTLVSAPAGNFPLAGGKTSALSFMLNGMLDFGDDDGINGFVGGGVGVARVKADYGINRFSSFVNDSDTGLAWQAIAGIRAPLSGNWDVGLKYRFFNAPNVDLLDINGRGVETRYRSHSILGSLIYNFGEPEAPPPPPAPPLPPPPPAPPAPPPEVVQCTPGPYIVFFEWDKSDITADAGSILDNAVLLTAIAVTHRSCWPVTRINQAHRNITSVCQSVATRRFAATLAARALRMAPLPRRPLVKAHHALKPLTAFANFRTVGWKSPTVRVRACKPIRSFGIEERGPVARPALFFCRPFLLSEEHSRNAWPARLRSPALESF